MLEEYRRCVMKTAAYEKKAREFLTQLLSTSNDDQRDYLAAHIMDFQRSVFGFNTRLHYASRGEQVAGLSERPDPLTLHQPTTEDQLRSTIQSASSNLPADFSFGVVKRLHRFSSGKETGTLIIGGRPVTVERPATDQPDICGIMSHPASFNELRACKALWKHSGTFKTTVGRTVDYDCQSRSKHVDDNSESWPRDALPLPDMGKVIADGVQRESAGKAPYEIPFWLQSLEALTTNIGRASRRTGTKWRGWHKS